MGFSVCIRVLSRRPPPLCISAANDRSQASKGPYFELSPWKTAHRTGIVMRSHVTGSGTVTGDPATLATAASVGAAAISAIRLQLLLLLPLQIPLLLF